MLKKNKQERIIILTTHFMEEADILGDRIAIMTKGRASCWGSSLFLKKKFGVGYNLTIDKVSKEKNPQIDAFVMARISKAQKLSEVSSEITYQLPNDSVKDFKEFFHSLDNRKNELGLKSYGIGVTTLEEVFLKVWEGKPIGEIEDNYEQSGEIPNYDEDYDDYCLLDESVTGFTLTMHQISAMTQARLRMIFRHFRPIVFEILYPSLLIVLGALIMSLSMNGNNLVTTVKTSDFPMKQEFNYAELGSVDPYDSAAVVDTVFNNSLFTPIHHEEPEEDDEKFKKRFAKFDDLMFEKKKMDQTYGLSLIHISPKPQNPKTPVHTWIIE